MTVTSAVNSVTYGGDGSTTVFSFNFIWGNASWIKVLLTSASGTVTTLNPSTYTLSTNAAQPGSIWGIGGTVTYPLTGNPIPADGSTITIERIVPDLQQTSVGNQSNVYPNVVETLADILTMITQQLNAQVTSSLQFPVVDQNLGLNAILPAANARVGKLISFDNFGNVQLTGSQSFIGGALNNSIYVTPAGLIAPGAISAPGGRITLTAATPIMIADVVNTSNVHYCTYNHPFIPIFNGFSYQMESGALGDDNIAGLNASLNLSGKLYDLFAYDAGGNFQLGFGPAWTNSTTRSATLTLFQGVLTNTNNITLNSGAATIVVNSGRATYLGTIYCTANGQTGVKLKPAAASGGSANIIGVFNAYNRIPVPALCRDSTSNWTYATNTWRTANNSTGNSISWVDGLQQVPVKATYNSTISFASNGNQSAVGVLLDATSGTPNLFSLCEESANVINMVSQSENFYPQLGLHNIQAMEISESGTQTFQAGGSQQSLILDLQI